MNREWYTAAELAGLPRMPTSSRGIRIAANRDGWQHRKRSAGKGCEYHVSSLPTEARQALAATETRIENAHAQAGRAEAARQKITDEQQRNATLRAGADGLARLATLTGNERTRAEARLAILDALRAFQQRSDQSKTAATHAFVTYYNDGAIDTADWIRAQVEAISAASLWRWQKAAKSEGAARLAGNYGNRRGSGKLDSQRELREFAEAMLAEHPHVRGKGLRRALVARYADRDDLALPSQSACERWLTRWKAQNKSLYLSIANPDGWNSKYRPAFGSMSEDVERINQRWELDSTPADLMLTDGRHHLVGVIDIYSRRLKLVVSKTSTARSVASVFRRSVIDWGVPESVKTDNGSDYVSNHITRVWDFFGVEQLICNPYSGWEKPHIERAFGTFMRDLIELAPGYCGHSVADRQAIEAQATFAKRLQDPDETFDIRMSATDLQSLCDRWTADIYEREVHSSLGCTPAEKGAGQRVRRIDDERVLDVLLSQAPDGGTRVVGKKGISIEGRQFIAAELADERVMGEPVQCLLDEHDMGRVYCFADLGAGWQFLCVAECPEITGISRQAVAAEVSARNERSVRDTRRELNRARKRHKTADVLDDILDHAREGAGRVAHLPGQHDAAESDGLSAAADAVAHDDTPVEDAREQLDDDTRQQIRAEITASDQATPRETSARERFRDWKAMVARTAPDSTERRGWSTYEQSIEFRVRYENAYDAEFDGHYEGCAHG